MKQMDVVSYFVLALLTLGLALVLGYIANVSGLYGAYVLQKCGETPPAFSEEFFLCSKEADTQRTYACLGVAFLIISVALQVLQWKRKRVS